MDSQPTPSGSEEPDENDEELEEPYWPTPQEVYPEDYPSKRL